MSPKRPRQVIVLVVITAVAAACDASQPAKPSATDGSSGRAQYSVAVGELPLANSTRLLVAARYRADSASVPIELATVELHVKIGDSVSLSLDADAAVLRAAGDSARVTVTVNSVVQSYALNELTSGGC